MTMNKEFIIKKNIFGGFDRRQVIDYLAQLQSKCGDSATHEEIESTKEKIKVLTFSRINHLMQLLKRLFDPSHLVNESFIHRGPTDKYGAQILGQFAGIHHH